MTIAARHSALTEVARARADWRPWLAVLETVAEAAGDRAWRIAVPDAPAVESGAPLLVGAAFSLDARLVRRWGRRLVATAAEAGGAAASLDRLARADADTLGELLEAALGQDTARLGELAVRTGVGGDALGAVASVMAVPLLRACAERWRERMPAAWDHGYCPICAAWPVVAEARGLERARRLRCGRCAADWPTAWLRCPYCGLDDHTRLGSLVVREEAEARRGVATRDVVRRTTVETCEACRGYLKTVTTLGPTAADELALVDLATVELDVRAIEAGYARPAGPGVAVHARVQLRGGVLAGWAGWRG